MLKLSKANIVSLNLLAATFGWLCVETVAEKKDQRKQKAATFGWLCVETICNGVIDKPNKQPPSGGCVLKLCG